MKRYIAGLLVGMALATVAYNAQPVEPTPVIQVVMASHSGNPPRCAEDEMLRGTGDFSHGRWTRYICVHPDDITAGAIEHDFRNQAVYATVRGSVCEHRRFWNREVGIRPSVTETCSDRY